METSHWAIELSTVFGIPFPLRRHLVYPSEIFTSVYTANSRWMTYNLEQINSIRLVVHTYTKCTATNQIHMFTSDRTYLITIIKRKWQNPPKVRCQARNALIHDELIHDVCTLGSTI